MALSPEQARRVYDRIGRAQDWQAVYEDPATKQLIESADFTTAQSVLEFGCGTGRFAAELLAHHLPPDAHYRGVDVSSTMVTLATERLRPWSGRAEVQGIDTGLPAGSGAARVDRFVANYVFDLLTPDDAARTLDQAADVLTAAGLLCVTNLTLGTTPATRLVSRAWTALWRRWPALLGGCRPIRLLDWLDDGWRIEHHDVIRAWGLCSETLVARRAVRPDDANHEDVDRSATFQQPGPGGYRRTSPPRGDEMEEPAQLSIRVAPARFQLGR